MKRSPILFIILTIFVILSACTIQGAEQSDLVNPTVENTPSSKPGDNTINKDKSSENIFPVWPPISNKIIEENNYENYTDLKVHNFENNIFLIGFGLGHNYLEARNWFLVKPDNDTYQKVEGDYTNIISYKNNIVQGYKSGSQLGACMFYDFPRLWECNIKTGESKDEPFYAYVGDWESFQVGGTGQNYVLKEIEQTESGFIIHLKTDWQLDGSPMGSITSTNDQIILTLQDVVIDNDISTITGVYTNQYKINNLVNTIISIDVGSDTHYNCEIKFIEPQYYTFIITLK